MVAIVILFLLLFSVPAAHGYTDEAINLLTRRRTSSDVYHYCIELATLPNDVSVNISDFGWYTPYIASATVDACNTTSVSTLPSVLPANTMLIIYEHACTMTEQAWNIQQRFSQIRLMVITKRTNTKYALTYNSTTMPVTIPVLVFLESDYDSMWGRFDGLTDVELSIDYPVDTSRKFRPAILLMFLLVLLVLLAGNFWAADEFKKSMKKKETESGTSSAESTPRVDDTAPVQVVTKNKPVRPIDDDDDEKPLPILPMTCCFIVLMVLFAVGWLLLLYFFPQVMIYVLQAMFCISSFSSLTRCFNRLSYFVPILRRYRTPSRVFQRPCIWTLGPLNLITVVAASIAVTLVVIWYVYRQREWAWVFQDILGAAVCITVTSIYRLGNMRVITIILVAFFLYDIFFVFVTPYIPIFRKDSTSPTPITVAPLGSSSSTRSVSRKSSRTPSVMEQVALGIGANGESVPLLFALPMFIPESEIDPCVTARKSMLGFGDVILPGMLLTFCKIFDIASANRIPVYYIQSVISYFVGLGLTHLALYLMNTAQPALLYIVPCLLISTIVTSLIRRELKELFTGKRIEAALEEPKEKPIVPLDTDLSNSVEDINDSARSDAGRHYATDNSFGSQSSSNDSVVVINEGNDARRR